MELLKVSSCSRNCKTTVHSCSPLPCEENSNPGNQTYDNTYFTLLMFPIPFNTPALSSANILLPLRHGDRQNLFQDLPERLAREQEVEQVVDIWTS